MGLLMLLLLLLLVAVHEEVDGRRVISRYVSLSRYSVDGRLM